MSKPTIQEMREQLVNNEIDYISQEIAVTSSLIKKVDESNLYESRFKTNIENIEVQKKEPLLIELSDFLEAIQNNTEIVSSGNDGIVALEIIEAARKSIKTNQVIKL